MLRRVSKLEHYSLEATDGELGKVRDFYFSDTDWVIRYLVADTRHWLPGRKVLLSPQVFDTPLWLADVFPVKLTRQQVKDSPEVSEHIPVSRRHELDLMAHYNWPIYWEMSANPYIQPVVFQVRPAVEQPEPAAERDTATAVDESNRDNHLWSVNELRGYRIQANDGDDLGSVEDMVIEDGTWAVRYMIVDIGQFITKKKVLISPQWISEIDLESERISLGLEPGSIIDSPHWDPIAPIGREYENVLFEHYGRPKYWV